LPIPGPPPEYGFGQAKAEDLDHDGRRDLAYYSADGTTLAGYGLDTNHDGKVDAYHKVVDGKVTERTTDSNFDGKLDTRATDKDGDGKFETSAPYLAPPKCDGGPC
jgi:hypothetical protein